MTNKEYGELMANFLHENGIKYCPLILNSEQANALNKRYKQLNKKNGQGKSKDFYIREYNTRR